ncbi:hypothetical protein [Aquimarina muelleri]|uniref:Uncharacterized protein n=1 Tax=Aquimarina muelleri TaxID=279356 RepID=A0A918JXQ0_9FLAO|nr:hypothetical protein [Aquimarina muelleri]MCX2762529.1 hypothetical protein [Aquimarina muelleri]GGX24426.1 hypothetical protein GCM10007384_27030 [Aquimarina muelleri]
MKLFCNNILNVIRYSVFFTVLFGMLLQPISKTITFFAEDSFELVEVDMEEDLEEEGKQEDDSVDEKIKLQILSFYNISFAYLLYGSYRKKLQPLRDFNLEIPIPPPELV